MLIDLVALATILLLMRLSDVFLFVWIVVCGCVWPSSLNVLCMGTAVLVLKNNASCSSSAADDITFHNIVDSSRTSPLFGVFSLLLYSKQWPPARL